MAKRVSRRKVVKTGAWGAAGIAAAKSVGPALGALGANERIRCAVAGIHGQGHHHCRMYAGMEDAELVYLVDPDRSLHEGWRKDAQERSNGRSNPKGLTDIREALEDKDLDVVSVATPNHWHSLITIWACQAGKDVYVEKPMSHNIFEGQMCIKAAEKHKRIIQHGTQNRTSDRWNRVAAVLRSGKLGKVLVSRGFCYKSSGGWNTRGDIGYAPIEKPPGHLDFNIWQGPAKFLDYHKNLVHYRWHWFWDTGNGDLGNQGVHQMDIARWCIPGAKLPKSCTAYGGRLGYSDQGEVASTHVAVMDYGDSQLIFETRGLPSKDYRGQKIGNIIECEEGDIVGGDFYPKGSKEPQPLPEVEWSRGPGGGDCFRNFIEAVKSRKVSDLNASVYEGHYSSALCHLANMSVRLGKKVPYYPKTDVFGDNEAANDSLDRTFAYLKENGIDLDKSGYTMGRKLVVDQNTETIVDDAEANAMLARDYRAPFVVPSKV